MICEQWQIVSIPEGPKFLGRGKRKDALFFNVPLFYFLFPHCPKTGRGELSSFSGLLFYTLGQEDHPDHEYLASHL